MEQIKGWWFGTTDKKLLYDDNRKIVIGETHKISGDIVPCHHGLHLSKRIIDALNYAPGPVIYRVVGSGVIIPHGDPVDKYACSERTYIAGGIDISNTLRLFARKCALDVIHLWNHPPDIVIKYLKTGDEAIRAAACAAAYAAACAAAGAASWAAAYAAAGVAGASWAVARDAAGAASWAAAYAAAGDAGASWAAARDAACAASWVAAYAAAGDAARDAALAAARSAARAASGEKFNKRLMSMISREING